MNVILTRGSWGIIITAVALSTVGCGGDGGGPGPGLESYFDAEPYGVASCDRVDEALRGRRELRLFTNGKVDVASMTRGLQRYYDRHDLQFFTSAASQTIAQPYAIDADESRLTTSLTRAFPGVNLNDEAALMADPVLYQRVLETAFKFFMKPMVDFIAAHSQEGTTVTNLIVLPQLVSPGGSPDLVPDGGELAGMSISRPLLTAFDASTPEGMMWNALDLPPAFTPVMFLDGALLSRVALRDPVLLDLVVAHEFGHSAGLVHREEPSNLMLSGVAPGLSHCTDGLDADQLALMQSTLFGAAPAAPMRSALRADSPRPSFPAGLLPALLRGDRAAIRKLMGPAMAPR